MARAKDIAKEKLLNYLSNPENEFMTRLRLSNEVLGYKNPNQLNAMFTAAEIQEIEDEALVLRKKRSARQRGNVLDAMYQKAVRGDVSAMKEYLDRTEGKVTDKLDVNADVKADVDMKWQVEIIGVDDGKED